jgi:DNA-binding transcriptional ArsR family regulator
MACHKIFEALGDPTRLEIVERLVANGPTPTVALVSDLGMTRQAATKHLHILESAGIVRSVSKGRVVLRIVEPGGMHEAKDWMDRHAQRWSRRLDALESHLEG